MSEVVRDSIQQSTDVLKTKRPGIIIGHNPAISIEVKFALDSACSTIEAPEIFGGLFEHPGGQLTLALLRDVSGVRFHFMLSRLYLPIFERDISQNMAAPFHAQTFSRALRGLNMRVEAGSKLNSDILKTSNGSCRGRRGCKSFNHCRRLLVFFGVGFLEFIVCLRFELEF